MKIGIAADHAGRALKELLSTSLTPTPQDYGVYGEDVVDYPDYALVLAKAVASGTIDRGIAICGTGIGMAIVANRFKNVRAATIWNEQTCLLSRRHNDTNILCLGARLLDHKQALSWTQLWLRTAFDAATRHQRRVAKTAAVGA